MTPIDHNSPLATHALLKGPNKQGEGRGGEVNIDAHNF